MATKYTQRMQDYIQALFADDDIEGQRGGFQRGGAQTSRKSQSWRLNSRSRPSKSPAWLNAELDSSSSSSSSSDSESDSNEGFGGMIRSRLQSRRGQRRGRKGFMSQRWDSDDEESFQPTRLGLGRKPRSARKGSMAQYWDILDDECYQPGRSTGSGQLVRGGRRSRDSRKGWESDEDESFQPHRYGKASRDEQQTGKMNVVNELIVDRERDEFQAHLLRQLIKSGQTHRNRNKIVHALIAGERVAPNQICRLLCEDWLLDHVTGSIAKTILDDQVDNRNTDQIIDDLVTGKEHRRRRRQEKKEHEEERISLQDCRPRH